MPNPSNLIKKKTMANAIKNVAKASKSQLQTSWSPPTSKHQLTVISNESNVSSLKISISKTTAKTEGNIIIGKNEFSTLSVNLTGTDEKRTWCFKSKSNMKLQDDRKNSCLADMLMEVYVFLPHCIPKYARRVLLHVLKSKDGNISLCRYKILVEDHDWQLALMQNKRVQLYLIYIKHDALVVKKKYARILLASP